MSAERRPCPHCEGLCMQDAAARAALLKAYVEALPLTERVPAEVYENRLSLCAGCPNLSEDLCVLCGCYAAARAAKARLGCPDVRHPRWLPCPEYFRQNPAGGRIERSGQGIDVL